MGKGDERTRTKKLMKLRIIDWVLEQTRDDPAALVIKMPYLESRLSAWHEAKTSGDADLMTKTYDDLLRGLEAEQNRRGIPKDLQRVLPNEMAEDVARAILTAQPEKMLETLREMKRAHGHFADGLMKQIGHFMPEALRFAAGQPSKLTGDLVWRQFVAGADQSDLLPSVPNHDIIAPTSL